MYQQVLFYADKEMEHIQLPENIQETIVRTYTSFTFSISNIVPNTSIDVNIIAYADDQTSKGFTVRIQGKEYTDWLEDDSYLIDLLKIKIQEYFA